MCLVNVECKADDTVVLKLKKANVEIVRLTSELLQSPAAHSMSEIIYEVLGL